MLVLAWAWSATCFAQNLPTLGSATAFDLPPPPHISDIRGLPAPEPRFYADATAGLAIATTDREAVRVFYKGAYALSDNVAINWTGVYAACAAGTTDQAFQNAVALRINWFRAMAGIPANISLYGPYSTQDQEAALIMSVNGALNHQPPSSWNCWSTSAYNGASNSNLALGLNGPQAITGYIRDPGSNNAAVGHRRWLLYPQTQSMGSGDTPAGTYNLTNVYAANATWVIDSNYGTARPAVRDSFVAWPPKGYVPYPVVYGRWSFSHSSADFTNATVTVSKGGVNVPVSREPMTNPAYGENTLVWLLQGTNDGTAWPKPAADETYTVTIANAILNGTAQTFSYPVTVFDPDTPTPGAPQSTIVPPATAQTGTPFAASIVPMANATAYQMALYRLADLPGTLLPGAVPNPWSYVTGPANAYNPIEATSYHLYHADFADQTLTLNKKLYIGANASLSFLSWFTYATDGQIAHVQLSLDDGTSWQDIYTQPGSNQTAQTTKTISLSSFAGRFARLRFVFSYVMGMNAYYQPDTGWYFKNVSFVNVRDMVDNQNATLPAGQTSTNFTTSTAGTHVMAARTEYQQTYFSDWGPASTFTVTTPQVDTTPNPFSFVDQADVEPGTPIISNAITVSGINAAAPISISGGSYAINGGTYTTANGTVSNGQNVTVRINAAAGYGATTAATLTIGGVSDTFSVTTRKQYTITTLMANTNPVVVGTPVTLTAIVTGNGGTPTGYVIFKDGPDTLGTANLSGGMGSYSTNSLGVGLHGLNTYYSGDNSYLPSTAPLVLDVIGLIGTTTTLATAPKPSNPGQAVQVTVSVALAGSGSAPAGIISVSGDGKSCTITLPATTCNLTFDTRGIKTLTATYGGDGVHAGSSATVQHPVGRLNLPSLMLLLQ